MGHIHCSVHVGGQRNAEEIAVRTWDHENSLILGYFTTAQSRSILAQFNLNWIGNDDPEQCEITNNHSSSSVLIAV